MKYIKYLILLLSLLNFNSSYAFDKDLHSKITKNLRCLICQGQSVYDSDSEFANSLKILVKKKLKEGKNEKEIYSFLREKYGQWILYQPEFDKSTYFLWIMPILMFLLGGAIIFKIFNKKKKLSIL